MNIGSVVLYKELSINFPWPFCCPYVLHIFILHSLDLESLMERTTRPTLKPLTHGNLITILIIDGGGIIKGLILGTIRQYNMM